MIGTDGEGDTTSSARIRVAATHDGTRKCNTAQSASQTERTGAIDLIGITFVGVTSGQWVNTASVLSIYSTGVTHQSRLRITGTATVEVTVAVGISTGLSYCVAKLAEASTAIASIQQERTPLLIAIVTSLLKSVVHCIPTHVLQHCKGQARKVFCCT